MAMMPRSHRMGNPLARASEPPSAMSSESEEWRQALSPSRHTSGRDADVPGEPQLDVILKEFTERWERGEVPSAEEYLRRLRSDRSSDAVELIYHSYCMAESAG